MTDQKALLLDALTAKQRLQFSVIIGCWLLGTAVYWWWWLSPEHVVGAHVMVANSLIFFYITALPAYSYFFALRMRRVNQERPLDAGWRLAMVVTKAPAEPWPMLKETLCSMLAQEPVHDTWLADEDPSPDTLNWCKSHGVKVSCRKQAANYHNQAWPRRRRCKEGNLAYFYDHYGYENYDIVVQLDADHRPQPGYLAAMARPFLDPKVGYVAAPSICDRNRETSWSARGRLYFEAVLHGPLQMGYCHGWQPICIGSHYAIRTTSLQQIGGLGPELAEDLSTSLMFIAKGWKGTFASEAICNGLGPDTFQDCMTQEFQWSKSITTLLLQYSLQWLSPLPWHLKAQLLFVQLFYPIRGLLSMAALVISAIALLTAYPWISLNYIRFLSLNGLEFLLTLLPCLWLQQHGFLRPNNIRVISWETWLFEMTRGPWVLLGVTSAIWDHLFKRSNGFLITRKDGLARTVPPGFLYPYCICALLAVGIAVAVPNAGPAQGYYLLILLVGSLFAVCCIAVVVLSKLESQTRWRHSYRNILASLVTSSVILAGWTMRQREVASTIAEPSLEQLSIFKSVLASTQQSNAK